MRNLERYLLFDDFNDWNGIWNRHRLLDSDGLGDLDYLRSDVLFRRQSTEIHKLLARFFQIRVIAVHSEVKMRLGSFMMNIVDVLSDKILLLSIEQLNLSLQMLRLLIEPFEVERRR